MSYWVGWLGVLLGGMAGGVLLVGIASGVLMNVMASVILFGWVSYWVGLLVEPVAHLGE